MAKKSQDEGLRIEDQGSSATAVAEPESPEWTPRDWAEFLVSDEAAAARLSEVLAPQVSSPKPQASKLLGIGQTCAWFEAGDETRVPLPALVIGNDGIDMVSLEVRYPNGTRREFHGVLALGSPRLVSEPQHAANGAWDDAAAAEVRRAERHAKAAAAAARRATERKLRQEADRKLREQEADQLVSMVASGLGFDEAIRKLGPHWTIDLAQTYWKKTGRVLPRTAVA